MIVVKLKDGTETPYDATTVLITLDKHGVPEWVQVGDLTENKLAAGDVIDLSCDSAEFLLRIDKPSVQVPIQRWSNLVHLNHRSRRIFALYDRKAEVVWSWPEQHDQ